MDNEQREHYIKEFERLDGLRLDHAKLTAKVDFIETELRMNKSETSTRFERLENKIDDLSRLFGDVSSEVKIIAVKIAGGAVTAGIALQLMLKHFELL